MALATAWLALVPVLGSAQEEAAAPGLDEITVTATKLGKTDLQSTPLTISAISGDDLQRGGLFDLKDVALFVPGANFVNSGNFSQAFIRGVGNVSTGAAIGGETNVSFYVDGVYLERGMGANTEFFDVERIEVLRGPQGVLYGRNATGGAVNIITRDPTEELSVAAGVTLGDYNKRRLDLGISGALAPGKVTGRMAASINRRDGFIRNLIGPDLQDEHSEGIRGKFRVQASERIVVTLAGDWYRQRAVGAVSPLVHVPGQSWPTLKAPVPADFWTVNVDLEDQGDNVDAYGLSVTVDATLSDAMEVKSITALRSWDRDFDWDIDNNQVQPANLFMVDEFDTLTQEFQFTLRHDRWIWQTGLFYYELDNLWGGLFQFDAIRPGLKIRPTLDLQSSAWAVFSNVTFRLSDKARVDVGVRYSDERKTADTTRVIELSPAIVFPPAISSTTARWDDVSPRLSVDYMLRDGLMLYASASKGFRAGAIADANPPPFPRDIRPETVWSYEIGAKSAWLDGRMRVNAAAFHYDYEDMQQVNVKDGVSVITNADSGTVQGLELEFMARPVAALTLTANASYLDTAYGAFSDADPVTNVVQSVDGNQFRYAPKHKMTLGAAYAFALGSDRTLSLHGDVTFVGKTWFSTTNNPALAQPAYSVANASAEFSTGGGRWSLIAYCKNVGGEEYYRDKTWAGMVPDAYQGRVGDPRNAGLQFVYRY